MIIFSYTIDKIYITGGFDGHDCMNTAEVYDPATNQWTMITAMRSRRSGVSCISYHGCIYVIGIKTYVFIKRDSLTTFYFVSDDVCTTYYYMRIALLF